MSVVIHRVLLSSRLLIVLLVPLAAASRQANVNSGVRRIYLSVESGDDRTSAI